MNIFHVHWEEDKMETEYYEYRCGDCGYTRSEPLPGNNFHWACPKCKVGNSRIITKINKGETHGKETN